MNYLYTHSSKGGNPEVVTSFIVATNFRETSNEPFYQSIPTMIQKKSSSSEESSDFDESSDTYNSQDTSNCSTC